MAAGGMEFCSFRPVTAGRLVLSKKGANSRDVTGWYITGQYCERVTLRNGAGKPFPNTDSHLPGGAQLQL